MANSQSFLPNLLPDDVYGTTVLPRANLRIRVGSSTATTNVTHPLEISGRYLQCQLHGTKLTASLSNFNQGEVPVCIQLGRRWHRGFGPGWEFINEYQKSPIATRGKNLNPVVVNKSVELKKLICDRPHLEDLRLSVLATMVNEISKSTIVRHPSEIISLLAYSPELQADPRYLAAHQQHGLSPHLYYAALRSGDPNLLPQLRVFEQELDLFISDLEDITPAELRQSLKSQLEAANRLRHHGHSWLASRYPSLKKMTSYNLIMVASFSTSPDTDQELELQRAREAIQPAHPKTAPLDLRHLVVDSGSHRLQITKSGQFVCNLHQDNWRCDKDLTTINATVAEMPALRDPIIRALTDRLSLSTPDLNIAPLARAWLETPAAWWHADDLLKFCGHIVNRNEIPAYLALGISPDQAELWAEQSIEAPKSILVAEAFNALRRQPAFGPGYVAALANSWNDSRLPDQALIKYLSDPALTESMLLHQEAGWPVRDILERIHQVELDSKVSQLPLPVPPVPWHQLQPAPWVISHLQQTPAVSATEEPQAQTVSL